jgi:predicted ribosome quality control (RQC) complex YloA/Tae2 family protein
MQPYPFPLEGVPCRRFESLMAAVEHASAAADSEDSAPSVLLPPGLLDALEGAVERSARRVERLRGELGRLGDPEGFQGRGDLLLARYRDVPAGKAEAVLQDFEGNEVAIELDPALSVHENAAAYYDRAARTRRAKARLPGMIREAGERHALLNGLLDAARGGDVDEARIRAALGRDAHARSAGDRAPGGPSLPYHVFRSSGGLEIRVGRNARRNADLTFRHSAPGDVWLHARHASGAHVILRWDRPGSPPVRDLHEAAVLAALNSKARTSGSVPVDWTLRKYVRKLRGAPPGTVVPERVKTVFVDPDPALPDALTPEPGG